MNTVEEHGDTLRILTGRRLALARWLWGAVVGSCVALTLAGLPALYSKLLSVCSGDQCAEVQLSPEQASDLSDAGISVGAHAAYQVALVLIVMLVSYAVAGLIFSRRSHDRLGLLVSAMLVLSAQHWGVFELAELYPILRLPVTLIEYLGIQLFLLFFFIFPNGRFAPRWTRWVMLTVFFFGMPRNLLPESSPYNPARFAALDAALWVSLLATVLFAQLYRWLRISGPVERQQTKWIVFGFAIVIPLAIGLDTLTGWLTPSGVSPSSAALLDLGRDTSDTLFTLFIPLSIGVAILRYRLWEIDVLVNRALVYGLLTATLAGVYLAGVGIMQYAARSITGGESQLAVVASTLAIAALSQPLRRRIQGTIDRRFYRRKYDAAQTLRSYGERLRDEVELESLRNRLMEVVGETLHPAHVSLWLKPPASETTQRETVR